MSCPSIGMELCNPAVCNYKKNHRWGFFPGSMTPLVLHNNPIGIYEISLMCVIFQGHVRVRFACLLFLSFKARLSSWLRTLPCFSNNTAHIYYSVSCLCLYYAELNAEQYGYLCHSIFGLRSTVRTPPGRSRLSRCIENHFRLSALLKTEMRSDLLASCLPHFSCGEVVKGFGRGSKELGIPTGKEKQ